MPVNPTLYNDMWGFDDFSRRVATKLFKQRESENPAERAYAESCIKTLCHTLDAMEAERASLLKEAIGMMGDILQEKAPA